MVKRIAPLFTEELILFCARLEIRMNAYASPDLAASHNLISQKGKKIKNELQKAQNRQYRLGSRGTAPPLPSGERRESKIPPQG